ncbi:MAG TPA: CocE/NonD family hydrolase [Solirubrobacterales bacterium]|nr:CocE/NonD family hydrolase [Solirubrobacterales bacterium]
MSAKTRAGGVQVELDVPVRMRDGVTLRANVFRPEGPEPRPVLLARTPYGKDDLTAIGWPGFDPVQDAARGFIVVVQDTRGRFASDGEWEPFRFEGQDGFDSVEWSARLPGSNGLVGMYGDSYNGNTQWLAAAERPPSLAAISPALTWAEPMDGLFARGGAVELGLALMWALATGLGDLERLGLQGNAVQDRVDAVIDEWDRLGKAGYQELPVEQGEVLRRLGVLDVGALRVLGDSRIAEWCRVTDAWDDVSLPTLHTAGWYDPFLQGTLDNYEAMAARGHDARLIVGPWAHNTFADPIGEGVFGMRAGMDGAPVHPLGSWNDLQLAWFRQHLEPETTAQLPDAPVRIFVMGRNEWREEPTWPPERAVTQRWFLCADGSLSSLSPAGEEPASEFVYDPADPVPTVGGNGVLWPGYRSGPFDQAEVEAREDVLLFTSDPLREDFEVTGRVRIVLHAESSAPSTDWVARICDVHPDGRSINICDGILRVADGAQVPKRHEIDLWSTSNVFLRGHRLRVHVTSSSFSRWDRNLNTGTQGDTRMAVAHQRVHHGVDRPSYIELPVIWGESG